MVKMGHDFAIFALTYTLSPGAVYPTQLKQAALALHHLLKEQHRDPSMVSSGYGHSTLPLPLPPPRALRWIATLIMYERQILLGGDSAGGNLVAALLQHIAHPHPQVPTFALPGPLRAALLISPWVSFRTDAPSFEANAESDYFGARAVGRAAAAYVAPGAEHDAYSEPATCPPGWWADVAGGAVRDVMVWAGGGEVLLDGIRGFADMVGAGFQRGEADPPSASGGDGGGGGGGAPEKPPRPRFSFVVTPRCAHEEMIIDELTFGRAKGDASREIEEWLSTVLT